MRISNLCLGLFLVAGCGASAGAGAHQAAIAREVTACADISPTQAAGPFAHRENIVSVEPLIQSSASAGARVPRVVGARAIFRPAAGTNAAILRREVACELARDQSLGRPMRGTEQFPEAVTGARVDVSSVTNGVAVDVAASDDASAREILRRALLLAHHAP